MSPRFLDDLDNFLKGPSRRVVEGEYTGTEGDVYFLRSVVVISQYNEIILILSIISGL